MYASAAWKLPTMALLPLMSTDAPKRPYSRIVRGSCSGGEGAGEGTSKTKAPAGERSSAFATPAIICVPSRSIATP